MLRPRQQTGSVSLLLIVLLVPLLLTLLTALKLGRRMTDEVELARAMRMQLQVSLANLDPLLEEQFGLLGVPESSLQPTVFASLVPKRFTLATARLSAIETLDDSTGLSDQISRLMAGRLPLHLLLPRAKTGLSDDRPVPADFSVRFEPVIDLMNTGDCWLQGDVGDLSDQFLDEWPAILQTASQAGLDSSVLPQLQRAQDQIDEWGRLRQNLSGALPLEHFLEKTAEFLDLLSQGWGNPLLQKVGLSEYCLCYLTCMVTVRKEETGTQEITTVTGAKLSDLAANRPAEIEQILTGQSDASRAAAEIRTTIVAFRSSLQLAAILKDSERLTALRSEATALAALITSFTSVPVDPEVLTILFAASAAIRSGLSDYEHLKSGYSLTLVPPSLLADTPSLFYADFLRLLLLNMPQENLLAGIARTIRKTCPQTYATRLRLNVAWPVSIFSEVTGPRQASMEMGYDG